jgi:zinc protease
MCHGRSPVKSTRIRFAVDGARESVNHKTFGVYLGFYRLTGAPDMNDRFPRKTRLALTATLALILASFASPFCFADHSAAPRKVIAIEGITEYELDNGLRVLLFPDPSTPNVTVNLTVLVGSRHEGYGETGMAHLLEHMVFKGTPLHRDVPRALKEHGAQFNGTTWVDRTNYFETMPGSDENLEFGIRLEADRLVNSFVKREDLLTEMTVVRNEFEMGENNPQYILSQRMMGVAYEWHNYGKSTIGNRSDIERVPIESLQSFYRKYYQPDNAMLVVAGKFDENKALGYIAKYFGALKRPQRPLDKTYTEEPPQDGERTVVLRRVGTVGVVGAVYHIPAGAHTDFPAVEVLNNILVSQPSGRLYKALVESKKAASVTGMAHGRHDPGVLEITAQLDRGNSLEAVRDTLIDVLEGLRKDPITTEEVERAKRKLLKDRELLMTKSNQIGITLSEWAAQGDWRLFFLHRDRIENVTTQDVTRVAQEYLRRSNRTVGLYVPTDKPDRVPVPATPSVGELVKNYKGREAVVAGEVFEPTPTNIEKRVQRSRLTSGLRVALLPTKTRGEAVVAELTLRFGNEESLKDYVRASQFLGPLLTHGTKQHTRQQLQDELDKLGARLNASSSLGELTIAVEAKRKNFPAVLEVLGEVLREPTFPTDQFDILKREFRTQLEKGLTEPHNLAVRELQRRLNPYEKEDIRYVPTIEESIARLEAVTPEQVRKLYTSQVGGQVGELAVVGDFDPEATVQLVEKFLGNWKADVSYRRIERPALTKVEGARQDLLTPDKANAMYLAGEMFALTDADADYPALELANFVLGGGSLSSRLGNRVRQKEGLAYGVGSMFSADALDKSARLMLFAICNPANMDKVDKAIAEELDKLLKSGIADDELAEAKKSLLAQRKVQRAADGRLASLLAERLYEGRTLAYDADLEAKIQTLTPDEVMSALRKHVVPKKLVILRAGDFKKANEKR